MQGRRRWLPAAAQGGLILAAWLSGALTGCGADLLPGERILGDEVPAVVLAGQAGSRLGAAVAVGVLDDQVVVGVAAPDAGEVFLYDAAGALLWSVSGDVGLGRGLAIVDERVLALAPGQGIVALDRSLDGGGPSLVEAAPAAVQVAFCADGSALSSPDPAAAVACGPDGQDLRSTCDDFGCQVLLDGAPLGTSSAGSDVGFSGDIACWGDAALTEDDAEGLLRCQDGTELVGLLGEHLGRTVADGYATGVFNKWVVPARARIRPIAGGEIWAVDRAAEATRLSVAADEGLVVVGVPGFASRDAGEGRVYIVDVEAAGR